MNILIFFAAREIFRLLTNVERRKGIPTITFDRFLDSFKCDYVRWKVHQEWIGKRKNENSINLFCLSYLECISYNPRLNQIISCSNEQQTALVIGCIRTSPSSEIQLTENGFTEKSQPNKSNDPKLTSRKNRNAIGAG